MKESPILFSAPMIRALLSDAKTQTRRIFKQATGLSLSAGMSDGEPGVAELSWLHGDGPGYEVHETVRHVRCPHGVPSNHLWVKETFFAWGRWETRFSAKKGRDEWHFVDMTLECDKSYVYPAAGIQPKLLGSKEHRGGVSPIWWKRPAIFMPRAASRITLEITDVRVEQLQGISKADAIAEGIEKTPNGFWSLYGQQSVDGTFSPYASYRALWESINGPGSWDLNPWVWALSFKRLP